MLRFPILVDETDGSQVRVSKEGLLPVELALKEGCLRRTVRSDIVGGALEGGSCSGSAQ